MQAPQTSFPGEEIATVRVELDGSDPLIWREVEVPTSITLHLFHLVIQRTIGWEDVHLWQFTADRQDYGLPADDDDWRPRPLLDARKVRLRDVLRPRRTTIGYLYDFGDGWEHRLVVTRLRAGDPSFAYPRYVAGERNGPPEDSGGLIGFYSKLDAVADPDHPDHADAKEWLGDYDPEHINEPAIRDALGRLARAQRRGRPGTRRRAAKRDPDAG